MSTTMDPSTQAAIDQYNAAVDASAAGASSSQDQISSTSDYYGCMVLMSGMIDQMLQQLEVFAAGDNVLGIEDNLIGQGLSDVQGAETATGQDQIDDMSGLVDTVNQLQAFIDEQESEGDNAILSQSDLDNMQSNLDSITGCFTDSNGTSNWGNAQGMANDMNNWTATSADGGYAPQISTLESSFSQMDKTVTGVQTLLTNKMQAMSELMKAAMASEKSFGDSMTKMTNTMVQGQTS